ncbi:MAG: DUF294 nucleotidyltransferase-like domain-containing protein [Bacteriovoracaceae bacterium]|nr:DUF294 nucleotidyltransferase-like domain-containing protein [Bacteriovoracaceae bacterium]
MSKDKKEKIYKELQAIFNNDSLKYSFSYWVMGSYARNENTINSDWDALLVFNKDLKREQKKQIIQKINLALNELSIMQDPKWNHMQKDWAMEFQQWQTHIIMYKKIKKPYAQQRLVALYDSVFVFGNPKINPFNIQLNLSHLKNLFLSQIIFILFSKKNNIYKIIQYTSSLAIPDHKKLNRSSQTRLKYLYELKILNSKEYLLLLKGLKRSPQKINYQVFFKIKYICLKTHLKVL